MFRSSREFVREVLRLCVKRGRRGRLRSYLEMAKKALGEGEEGRDFWSELLPPLLERAVERADETALEILLDFAHGGDSPPVQTRYTGFDINLRLSNGYFQS